MLALIAFLPILIVGILMVVKDWPSTKAMPVGFLVSLVIAGIFWKMPIKWMVAATISGAVNTFDILFIVYGALLILGTLRKSGGIDGISNSMAYVSTDRRVQVILIGFLMGAFFEGAAGFGTPAAVAAPLLMGMGFPPLVAAMVSLIGNSAPVTFGAVGTPVIGGFSHLKDLAIANGYTQGLYQFLTEIGGFAAILHLIIGSFIPLGSDLRGKTAGVIGTGKIGKVMIEILTGFGMNVIAYDIFPDIKSDVNYVTLDELFSKSDVITLHTPLTPETKYIINSASISKMKDGVFLINTARGGLIKTKDLIKALEEDKFGGVGLDVCEQESEYFYENKSQIANKDEDLKKLLSFNKLILTSHQAFFTKDAMRAIAKVTLTNFKNFIENGDLTNEVNLFLGSIKE